MFRNPTADVIVVLVIVLLFFGPKRLPGLGKSLGSGIREFKDSITGHSGDEDEPSALPGASAEAPHESRPSAGPAAPPPAAPAEPGAGAGTPPRAEHS